jgi:hypothetical protein
MQSAHIAWWSEGLCLTSRLGKSRVKGGKVPPVEAHQTECYSYHQASHGRPGKVPCPYAERYTPRNIRWDGREPRELRPGPDPLSNCSRPTFERMRAAPPSDDATRRANRRQATVDCRLGSTCAPPHRDCVRHPHRRHAVPCRTPGPSASMRGSGVTCRPPTHHSARPCR